MKAGTRISSAAIAGDRLRVEMAKSSARRRPPKPKPAPENEPPPVEFVKGVLIEARDAARNAVLDEHATHGEHGAMMIGAQGFAEIHIAVGGKSKMRRRLSEASAEIAQVDFGRDHFKKSYVLWFTEMYGWAACGRTVFVQEIGLEAAAKLLQQHLGIESHVWTREN